MLFNTGKGPMQRYELSLSGPVDSVGEEAWNDILTKVYKFLETEGVHNYGKEIIIKNGMRLLLLTLKLDELNKTIAFFEQQNIERVEKNNPLN